MAVDRSRAKKAYRDFTGHNPSREYTARLDARDVAGWKIGQAVGVAYEATRDGETARYFHEFKKSARPDLVSRDDGRQLYFTGGRYKVTDRGIEDMPSLFVVNPSPRRKKKGSSSMAKRRRRSAPRRRAVTVFATNPVRRRRRRASSPVAFRRNPSRRRRSVARAVRRYRRNPSARGMTVSFMKLFGPAIGIGAGAVGTEVIMGYLPLPANMKTGVMRHVTKGAVGIGVGLLLGKVLKQRKLGNLFALGALTIATHDALKETITKTLPSVRMGAYLPYQPGALGAYVPPVHGSLGYYNPGQTLDYSAMGGHMSAGEGSPDFGV